MRDNALKTLHYAFDCVTIEKHSITVAQADGERPPYPVTVAVNLSEGKPVGRLLNSLVVSATSRIG